MNKKLVFFICLIGIILSAACVSAAEDIGQTNIEDTSNLDANGDILAISSSENEILGADEPGTFTELQQMIDSGNATINLTKDYQLDGAFNSYAIKIKNPITINGNGHSIDALGKYGIRIFEISQVTSGIILDNITFKNGNSDAHGGAINIISALSDSKFTNLNFINNTAINNGGAVRFYHTSANNLFENVTFIDNTANGGNGGALYITETSTSDTFNNVRFENNVAINKDKKVDGGAINFHGKVTGATFTNVTFYKNRAEKSAGGAINIDNGIENSIFNNTHFIDNAAKTGGAIGITYKNNYISSLTFENTEFIHNTALEDDGGAINIGPWGFTDLTGTTFKKVSFINNTAQQNGGALYVTKDTISNTFEDVVFINNTAKENDGGAVRFGASNQNYITRENTFKNVKFINNTADQNGGALYVTGESTSNIFETVDFINNVAENWDGGAINFYNAVKDTSFNDILFYKNSAPNSGGGAVNCDKGMENTTFNNTIFADNHALYTSAIAISASGETSSTTIENSVFYNNTANNYLIWIGNSVSDNVIHDSIFLNNGDFNFYPITVTGNIELTDNWFGNNATNYNENPDVNYNLDNWLFLNATASPAAITLNQTSNITFKFSSYRDGSGVKEYDGPVYVYLKLNSTLGSMDRPVASTNDEIVYTPSESGNGSVTGTFKNAYYTINIENSKIPTEITLLNDTLDVKVLVFIPDVATLDPAEAGNLSYSSSNSSVAVIFKDRIIPVGTGQANITVSFAGNDIYAAAENKTIPINVELNDARVSVDNDTLELFVEDTYAINATTVPDFLIKYYTTNYTSSDESVATVDKNGTVTAVGEGNAIITVTVGDDKIFAKNSTTVNVTVSRIPTEITVANETLEMNPLDIAAINATLKPAEAGSLTYNTTNSSVAIVLFGNIIAAGEGEATITVSFNGTAKYAPSEKTINVTVTKIPTEISVNETAIEMNPLDTAAINATLTPAGAGSLSYVSSNTSVATVILGQIVALGEGEATITVLFNGNIRYAAAENKTIDVTVKKIPTEITIENTTIEMAPLDIAPAGANLTNNASNLFLNYVSSNSSVAIVVLGEIVALSEGEATITVSFNGTTRYAAAENKTIEVKVKKIPTEITVESDAIEMNPWDVVSAGAKLTPGLDIELNYTSSDANVATVVLGEIVAVGEGEATITVSFNGDIRYAAAESKTIDVKVTKIPTEITIENTTIEMAPLDIAPTGADLINASNLFLNYVSSNSSVATVVLGQIVAVGEGTATITVSFNGNARYIAAENKTIEVTVKKIPTEITINNETMDLKVLDAVPSGANLIPGLDLTLSYSTSNSSVATVVLGQIVAFGEGTATITVSFNGTTRYAAAESKTITVTVSLRDVSVIVENDTLDLTVDDTYTINAITDPAFLKYLTIKYTSSDESVATVAQNGTVTAVGEGTAIITVSAGGGKVYVINSTNVTVTVNRIGYEPDVTLDDKTLTVEVPENATGDITLIIGDETITAPIENGIATFDLSDVPAGDYNASITYDGDRLYDGFDIDYPISIEPEFIITAEDVTKYYGGSERFNAILTDAEGKAIAGAKVLISINGQEYERTTDANGIASIGINLNAGEYPVVVSYNGSSVDAKVTILTTVNGTDLVKVFRNSTQYYATFRDSEGKYLKEGSTVRFNINGVMYDRQVGQNGLARLNINLNPGQYIITAMNDVTGERTANNITVLSRITETKDITKYYRNGTQYTAKIIGDDGKAVGAGETVRFNINGVFYERQTDANGIVKLNINLQPGDYIITAEYKECMVSNNVRVLPVLTASDLTKKYGTPTPFAATLVDGQGNPYANQKVEFNINGVFYYRTTESNGQAKLNINLQPGQYIITSGYNGSYIANRVTVTA